MTANSQKDEMGNLRALLEARGGRSGAPPIPRGKGLEEWKSLRREQFRSMLRMDDRRVEPGGVTLSARMADGLCREEISYAVRGGRVRATLLRPAGAAGPLPAVIALHDHGGYYYYGREKLLESSAPNDALAGFREAYYGGRGWADALARKGYVVLAADAFYFGDRRLDHDSLCDEARSRLPASTAGLLPGSPAYIDAYNRNAAQYEKEVLKHISTLSLTWPGILAEDDRRAVDYLCGRPEVDARRIACCGLSIGGFRSALLCGLDPRIRCAVVAGWMCSFRSLIYRQLRDHTYMLYLPHLQEMGDLADITGLAAPAPLLVQQCLKDELFPLQGMEEAAKRLADYYENAVEQLAVRYYDTPHAFNLAMQEDAFDWLDRWLRAADRPV